jgi:hypothetical protein
MLRLLTNKAAADYLRGERELRDLATLFLSWHAGGGGASAVSGGASVVGGGAAAAAAAGVSGVAVGAGTDEPLLLSAMALCRRHVPHHR